MINDHIMRKLKAISLVLLLCLGIQARAGEGMWIPVLVGEMNIGEMRERGFEVTAEDIYAVNQASLTDAIVRFGNGCTGGLISDKGLIITNHHCGNSYIQQHSSVEHDYLTNGFVARSLDEELPNEELTVTFLRRMEDVTERVLAGVNDDCNEAERAKQVRANINTIVAEAKKDTHYEAAVESFYYGNQYFLFVYEIFNDVRLVFAPPAGIGDFGAEEDNWTWPRHTGDFSLFRVYANSKNKPAAYSTDNVPYKPEYHFKVSTEGVKKGDPTMVLGYPAVTTQYVPSYHIEMLRDLIYPKVVEIRDAKLDVINRYVEDDIKIRIQYAAKHSAIANSWKRWKGELKGFESLRAVDRKRDYETRFNEWVAQDPARKDKYGNVVSEYEAIYGEFGKYRMAREYLLEVMGARGIEAIWLAGQFERLLQLIEQGKDADQINEEKDFLKDLLDKHYKDYSKDVDRDIAVKLVEMMDNDLKGEFRPAFLDLIGSKFKGNHKTFVDELFARSIFDDQDKLNELVAKIDKKKVKTVKKDPAYRYFSDLRGVFYNSVDGRFKVLSNKLDSLNRIWMSGLMEFDTAKVFYPDANRTMRLAYGNVKGYEPRDGVIYKYRTTLDGVMEKHNPAVYEFNVPEKVIELYNSKDFGPYAEDGVLTVCFVADNHTTGGNSGSPVLNRRGELIGVNFDRAWDGITSDLVFNTELSRNISVDIRYVLFVIDKWAGATNLIDEIFPGR